MKKIKQIEAIKSTTMFMIDEAVEQEFDALINQKVEAYKQAMSNIDNYDGLCEFIKDNPDSIKMLETVLGISGEKMKRVVTMMRVNKGYTFTTEWDEDRLQKELKNDPSLLSEYCQLFLNGKNMERFQKFIPKFILDDFCIDSNVMKRVENSETLAKFFKNKNYTAYTSTYANSYVARVKRQIEQIITPLGFNLLYGEIENVGKDLMYLTDGEKYIIITCHYSLTTGQGQSDYYRKIQPIYQNIRKRDNIQLVNILDGAGWVARSSDFKKVYNDCNFYANLSNINIISEVTKEFFNIQ